MSVKSLVLDKIRTVAKAQFPRVPDNVISNFIDSQVKLLEESDSIVYCEDCGLTFYLGKKNAQLIVVNNTFLDFKMLTFRHAWDTGHKVKISIRYFKQQISKLNKMFPLKDYLPIFDEWNDIDYSVVVEKRREYLKSRGDSRAYQPFDANWDSNSRCVCSVCGAAHYDPRDACYCCRDGKGWLPVGEVEKIAVKKI